MYNLTSTIVVLVLITAFRNLDKMHMCKNKPSLAGILNLQFFSEPQ